MESNKSENPYASPEQSIGFEALIPETITYTKLIGLLGISAIIFGLFGTLIGAIIGTLNPAYYEYFFPNHPSSALELGMTQGLLQGIGAGIGVGLCLSGLLTWYRSRLKYIQSKLNKKVNNSK